MSDETPPDVPAELVEQVEPLIRSLPQEKQTQLRQIIATSIQYHQGPLPPPTMMAEYGQVIPDGANRLMILVEKQTDHRIAMESELVRGRVAVTKRGQAIAGCLSIFFGLVAGVLGYFNHDVLAGSIGVTTIIGLAVVFVLGKEPGAGKNRAAPEGEQQPSTPRAPRKRK
jgi:uncharacterized membrane protein